MSNSSSTEALKDVCLRLLSAESEAEVQEIIESVPEMRDGNNWRPLDRRETNFNVTSNQASDGGKALTELMTNMVDAVLMKHAFLKGIDPEGSGAPENMYDAVDVLVKNLRGGKLANLDPKDPWLREFAEKNLVIGITGARSGGKGLPCYTFVDNGEGQQAARFEGTFLSLSAGNKKSIPFVQGKYNMGSSGVLRYCGLHWFKLIVSRRYDRRSGWAWTIMRRRPDDGDSMPVAEYFIPQGSGIPSFDGDTLYPFRTMSGRRYEGVMLETGTVVKLFDYQIGSKFRSFKGLRGTLNENLIETILPFRLLDFRQIPRNRKASAAVRRRGGDPEEGVDPRPFHGMEFLLLRSRKEEDYEDEEEDGAIGEGKLSVGIIKDPDLGEISISAIRLKREIPSWLRYNNARVFHTVNGQVQYKQTRGYLSQNCKLPALKDRVVVVVDASRLTFFAHNEVWKGDREHISKTVTGERYLEQVTTAIRESTVLQEFQKEIAQEELERAVQVDGKELFQKLVDTDRNFAGLLSGRDPSIHLRPPGPKKDDSSWDEGKYSPTFLRLDGRFKKDGLEVPINRTRQAVARTDAENGYLNRTDNPGRVVIPGYVQAKFGIREHLHDGRLTLRFAPQEDDLTVGDTFIFKIALKDDAMAEAAESEELVLRVTEEQDAPPPGPKPDRARNDPTLELPKYVLLTRDGRDIDGYSVEAWPEGFDDRDGGLMQDLGEEGVVYKINYDNAWHLKYLKQQPSKVARRAVTGKYILGMCTLMLGYEHALRSLQSENGSEHGGVAEVADEFRRLAARGAASTVLTLTEHLPRVMGRSGDPGEPLDALPGIFGDDGPN